MNKKDKRNALLILGTFAAVYFFRPRPDALTKLSVTKRKMNTQSNDEAQGVGMGPIAGFSGVY